MAVEFANKAASVVGTTPADLVLGEATCCIEVRDMNSLSSIGVAVIVEGIVLPEDWLEAALERIRLATRPRG